jgi:hypothetical protein
LPTWISSRPLQKRGCSTTSAPDLRRHQIRRRGYAG